MTAKNVVVTGAGSGIGRDYVLTLLKKGHNVALVGRTKLNLEETVELAGDVQAKAIVCPADVSVEEDVRRLFDEVLKAFSRVDVLFNNAGIAALSTSIEQIDIDTWNAVVNTNLTGSFLCTREAFRIMKNQKPQGGRIINNGSISAYVPRPFSAPYTTTKHAITGLTRSTSLDGRKYNIACGQIDIGNASTDMTSKMSSGVPQADGSIAEEATMSVENVTKALMYMTDLPLEANVLFMTVMANQMPYVGRG